MGHGVGESDFETFPRTITKDTLAHLLRGNPFMASAINSETMADGTQRLCLSSHPAKCNDCPNFFQKFTSCMDSKCDHIHSHVLLPMHPCKLAYFAFHHGCWPVYSD